MHKFKVGDSVGLESAALTVAELSVARAIGRYPEDKARSLPSKAPGEMNLRAVLFKDRV